MFEYLTSKEYRDASKDYSKAKGNVQKLKGIKTDLTNDSSSVSAINKRIDYIYEDFCKVVKTGSVRSKVKSKLSAMKEPYQGSDSLITNAVDCIDYEIQNQNRKMSNADSTMNAIKNKNTNGGGGW